MSVSAPVITVQSMHVGQCSAQVRDLKPSVQLTKTTEAVVRDNERDRTKTAKVLSVKLKQYNQKWSSPHRSRQ